MLPTVFSYKETQFQRLPWPKAATDNYFNLYETGRYREIVYTTMNEGIKIKDGHLNITTSWT